MSCISVRKDLFATSPVTPLISLTEEKKAKSTVRNTKRKSHPTYMNPYGRHFEVTKSNEYKSLRNFGLWYKPPEDDESPLCHMRQLEQYNTSLVTECATPAEDCVTTIDVFVGEARQNEISVKECVEDTQKCVTQVAEDVSQATSAEKKSQNYTEKPEIITIGPNGTTISLTDYESIVWSTVKFALGDLLLLVFDRDTLLTNTLYGKASNKGQLDPHKVEDIIYCVQHNIKCTEREVRRAIGQKIAQFKP